MRECLGWVTNCSDERRCPQNWLEYAVSELPLTVYCHVCEQQVQLVATEQELNEAADESQLAAYPVVPCAGSAPAPVEPYSEDDEAVVPSNGAPPPPAARPTPAPPPRALFCVLGNGESIKLDKDTMIIGRSRTCDIVIASAKVSRQHASITRQNGDFYIEDLGSANGLWKDGEKVSRTKIQDGDVYTISEETLSFEAR